MLRRLLPLLLVALAAALAVGCGSSSSSSNSGDADPATAAPATSVFFADVQIKPQGELKSSVQAAGRKLLNGKDPGTEIEKQLDQALAKGSSGLTFSKDIKPLLGRRAGVFVSGLTGAGASAAAVVGLTDEGKAKDLLDKSSKQTATYKGVSYQVEKGGTAAAVTNGFLVAGTTDGFKAAIDTLKGGQSLSSSSAYKDATGKVSTDGLGLFYLDTPRFLDVIAQANPQAGLALGQLRSLPQFQNLKPAAVALLVDPSAIRVETAAKSGSSAAAEAIKSLPGNSWLALAAPSAGDAVRKQIATAGQLAGGQGILTLKRALRDQTGLDLDKDLLNWIDGMSLYAAGTSVISLEAGIVLDSKDPAASKRFLTKVGALIRRAGKVPFRVVPGGFEIKPRKAPAPITFVVRGDKVVIAYGNDAVNRALHPSGKLESAPIYTEATKALGGAQPSFLLSIPAIVQLVQSTGQAGSPQFAKALPYLRALGPLAAGVANANGQGRGEFALGLR